MKSKTEAFRKYLINNSFQLTKQREIILQSFIKSSGHLSVEELYDRVKKKDSSIGHATVFRTVKLLVKAGIANEVDFGDKVKKYEVIYECKHHDHLVCSRCGKLIEVVDQEIEILQDKMCEKYDFLPKSHRLEIFGVCKECKS